MFRCVKILFLLSFLTACKAEVKDVVVDKPIDYQISLINFAFYNSEFENWMSFPVWFNDSLILKNQISKIQREVYSIDFSDSTQFTNEILDKRWVYQFGNDGTVANLGVEVVYDAKAISAVEFKYKGFDPLTGYSQVLVSEKELADYENLPYVIHNRNKTNDNWSSFTEWSNQYQLFILNDEQHWKSLVIDTLIGPKAVDFIFWGGMLRPLRSYKVSNLVEENMIRNFKYYDNRLMEVERVEDPFRIKRSFIHNDQGVLTEIMDSTFSMGGFVSAAVLEVKYKDGLPFELTKSLVNKEEKKLIFKEKLHYTFRQKPN